MLSVKVDLTAYGSIIINIWNIWKNIHKNRINLVAQGRMCLITWVCVLSHEEFDMPLKHDRRWIYIGLMYYEHIGNNYSKTVWGNGKIWRTWLYRMHSVHERSHICFFSDILTKCLIRYESTQITQDLFKVNMVELDDMLPYSRSTYHHPIHRQQSLVALLMVLPV